MNTFPTSFRQVFLLGFTLRLSLLLYGEYQDRYLSPLRYTDIDYDVFTDAARHVHNDNSPYERATYRYTPLLSWLLLPNVTLFTSFGKLLFVLADLTVGWAIEEGLRKRGVPERERLKAGIAWLWNPVVANISTRGNAESLLGAIVLSSFHALQSRYITLSACLFGLAVHFKIYPVIYAIPMLMFLDESGPRNEKMGIWKSILGFVTMTRVKFAVISASTFLLLTGGMYAIYGYEFLYETYLYHVIRRDHRHNFSLWFYNMYLSSVPSPTDSSSSSSFSFLAEFLSPYLGLLAFVPQMGTVAALGFAYGKDDVYFAAFVQTFAFVMWNKVCTSQYFMWYICLFPFVLSSTRLEFKYKGLAMILAWIGGQGIWLFFAYRLEFLGMNTYYELWLSGMLFFVVNTWILYEIIKSHVVAYEKREVKKSR